MTPKEFEKLGRAMFMVDNWKSGFKHKLGVGRKTVNRWWTGETPISDDREKQILKLLTAQYKKLGELIDYYVRKGSL